VTDDVLYEIQRSLGRIENKIDNNAAALSTHTAHDETVQKALFERIEALQLGSAKQKGFVTAIVSVGSALGAGAGYLLERSGWFGHHG
jgi:hypothetical protein